MDDLSKYLGFFGACIGASYYIGTVIGGSAKRKHDYITPEICELHRKMEAENIKHLSDKVDLLLGHFGLKIQVKNPD
jgi:hypothetical protein